MTSVFIRIRREERNTQEGGNVTMDAEIHTKAKDNGHPKGWERQEMTPSRASRRGVAPTVLDFRLLASRSFKE